MKNKIFILMLGMILLIGIFGEVSASKSFLGTYKQGTCFQLIQTCPDCTYNNISRVLYPGDNGQAMGMVTMTRDDTYYNRTFCNGSILGTYEAMGFGDPAGTKDTWNYYFEVTSTGVTGTSVLNNTIFIILGALFLIFLALGIYFKLPSLGFISSVLLILLGVYTMIYGFNNITNLYTRGAAISIIGLGFIIMFVSAYEWLHWGGGEGD